MNPAQIKTEIAELTKVVRYSAGAKANVAATKIVSLKRKLAEIEQEKAN